MMKKFLLFILFSAAAILNAQDLSGVKICVNPGHGGHDSNDRFIPATGFWESEGNLAKGLNLRDLLESYGAEVVITRTENNSSDDLPLSQIVAIANQNNVDYMHAVHSNAYNAQSNYTLVLFQGGDNAPTYPLAKTMSTYVSEEIQKNDRTTARYVRGDFDFYGTGQAYLGVFRGLNMPGSLSEGSFHDYVPESWRLKNNAYCRHEAIAIARAFLRLFNGGKDSTGAIAGVVRDPNKNVGYYYIPSTNDQKVPINNITVTLQPGNLVFRGDNNNNGFYLFDNLNPGLYRIYIEADGFGKDSVDVNVSANTSTFADRNLIEPADYSVPTITAVSPDSSAENISLQNRISIDFDIRMNTTSTQNAFSVSPAVNGVLNWENNNRRLIFIPTSKFQPGVKYSVKIDSSAKTNWGVSLGKIFSFDFTTKSKLNLITNYPKNGQNNISSTVQVNFKFDGPISAGSLGGNILFVDSSGNNVPVFVNSNAYSDSMIIFEPQTPLMSNAVYKIILKEGISDLDGLTINTNDEISFRTEGKQYVGGNIFDNFEFIGSWQDPASAEGSFGINTDETSFKITSSRKLNGIRSANLNYTFTGDSGSVVLFNSAKPSVGANDSSKFGIWIFGDLSGNILEYKFNDQSENSFTVFIDTLNWTGWKMKEISLGEISANTGEKFLNSVIVKQNPKGEKSGSLYFDDAQTDVITGIEKTDKMTPQTFSLSQNYPNPFNPSTVINFNLPEKEFVTLKVYNILGKEITTLVNKEMNSGNYKINFNSGKYNLPSGVYIYKLNAGNFVSTKKMILLK